MSTGMARRMITDTDTDTDTNTNTNGRMSANGRTNMNDCMNRSTQA
jgi:hypothetical protein